MENKFFSKNVKHAYFFVLVTLVSFHFLATKPLTYHYLKTFERQKVKRSIGILKSPI